MNRNLLLFQLIVTVKICGGYINLSSQLAIDPHFSFVQEKATK